jgi:hypothetical protein
MNIISKVWKVQLVLKLDLLYMQHPISNEDPYIFIYISRILRISLKSAIARFDSLKLTI